MKQINLIGISGKIGSGKDTVFEIIQKLCLTNNGPSWENKKFSDKLKDIVCILLGCTREQLEDREFKNSKLPPEWDKYIFGIDKYVSRDTIIEEYKKVWNVYPSTYWIESQRISITYRQLLQNIGTDLFRDQLHPNTWINALFADYKEVKKYYKNNAEGLIKEGYAYRKVPNWIITDVRFPNEAKAIKDRGGIIIRVNRAAHGTSMTDLVSAHPSETALDTFEFDYTINNDGDLEKLISLVRDILEKENII
jgi:deoxyadenosine/deoxycytidine kinase